MLRHALPLLLPLLALFATAPSAPAQLASLSTLDRELSGTVDKVAKAVVRIGPGFSGICIHDGGYILTDSNVQRWLERQGHGQEQGPNTVSVTFPDQSTHEAKIVEVDLPTATAVLEIQSRGRFPAVRPGNPSALEVGHFMLTIGNSFGSASESKPSVTCGVLSAIHRDEQGRPQLLETSASTNRGQEGGPYFNVDGDLVGLEKSLPNGQDLAILTPIDRIRDAYADRSGRDRYFDKPRAISPPRSKTQILSKAFAISAARARPGVCTLVITRREKEPEDEASVEEADAPRIEPPGEDGSGPDGEKRKEKGGKDKENEKKEENEEKKPPLVPPRDGPVTGTLIDQKGFVLAPLPAFDDTVESIEALLHDGRRFRASLISRDHKAGLALLLLDKPPHETLPILPEADEALRIGQFVLAVGAPHGPPAAPDPFVTVGILSAQGQLDPYKSALQTDAGVNVKNAGGALVDLRGRLLGIILPPAAPFGQNSGLGFGMPIADVRAALPRLMEGRDVEPAYIGVVLQDAADRAGVLVKEVQPGHAAEQAGMTDGDVITHLDGARVETRQELSDFMWKHKSPGQPVRIDLLRGGKPVQLTLTLGRRPGT